MNPQVAFLLSRALESIQSSRLPTAMLYLSQALKIQSNNSECLRLIGVVHALKGEHHEAIVKFEQAIALSPRSGITYSNKGNALQELGRFEEAILCYDKAIALMPNYHEAYNNKGNALQELNQYEDAICCYNRAIAIMPNYHDAYTNKGNALQELNQYQDAIFYHDKAIALMPNFHEAYNNKGNALQELNQYQDAICCYDKAIEIMPNYYNAYINKGNALKSIKLYQEAIECYDKLLTIRGDSAADAFSNKGAIFSELLQISDSRKWLERAISIDANHSLSKYNLARLDFVQLNFKDGWRGYESRWLVKHHNSPALKTSKPTWSGNLKCKKLYIWSEQGIGDQLLYISMLHELDGLCQKKIVSSDKKLLSIFRRSFPDYEFINKDDLLSECYYDEQIPIGSLGGIFRNSLEDFQRARHPYIVDDAIRTQAIKLRPEFNKNITCGISWGSTNKTVGGDKSIPINQMYPILGMKSIEFVNLQYGDVSSSLLQVKQDLGKEILCLDQINLFDDVDGALSIIAACNIVVTSSNTTAHLAGALGKETLLLVPYSVGKLWYWHAIDGKSIWYPSVRVFEQEQQGDWSAPVNAVKQYLERRFG
jgi:tetratricopeptide (TPR) repeat protein